MSDYDADTCDKCERHGYERGKAEAQRDYGLLRELACDMERARDKAQGEVERLQRRGGMAETLLAGARESERMARAHAAELRERNRALREALRALYVHDEDDPDSTARRDARALLAQEEEGT